jgi:hypothetical protein
MQLKINFSRYFVVLFILSFAILSCRNKADTVESGDQPVFETKEFQDFYKQFGADSAFQMEHVVFPLEGMKAPADTTTMADQDFRWQMEDWVIHRPYDDSNGTFNREFKSINGVVIEKIYDNSGTFTMERRFGKLSSGWHLIYYRELGRY